MKVPEYSDPFPSEDRMNSEQRRFYGFWVSSWHSGHAIPLDGQVSYAFCYLYSVLSFQVEKVVGVLERMYSAYPNEGSLTSSVRGWLSDCYVTQRRYEKALAVFPGLSLNSRTSFLTDKKLNLKLFTGNRISGHEAVAMLGPRLAAFDKAILPQMTDYVGIQLQSRETEKAVNLLKLWAPYAPQTRYEIFTGYLGATEIDLRFYHFSICEVAVEAVLEVAREAENTVKEERGLPRATQSWAEETNLCCRLRKFFSAEPVIHHLRPEWLDHKHLDIVLPERGVAVEYRLLDEFGVTGSRLPATALRQGPNGDAQKRSLCEAHGLRIVEVGPGYNFDSLIERIIKSNRKTRR